MRTRVKICGITREEDALAAVHCGADAVGFIFYPGSPRAVTAPTARSIISALPPFVSPVGVFVDATVAEVCDTVAETGVRVVQLHGSESLDFVRTIPYPVIKVFRPGPGFRTEEFEAFRGATIMIDTYMTGKIGGTGETADWNVALRAKRFGRIILGGGLAADNIEVAITTVRPYAVDVSSGVEDRPGRKNHDLMRRFLDGVRHADEVQKGE
jgi:phosphoribosylanthranilate isomerase